MKLEYRTLRMSNFEYGREKIGRGTCLNPTLKRRIIPRFEYETI